MSKNTKAMFEHLKSGEGPGLAAVAAHAASSLRDAAGRGWDEGKALFDHGRAELAAALFSGSSYVMYMKGEPHLGPEIDQGQDAADRQPDLGREL